MSRHLVNYQFMGLLAAGFGEAEISIGVIYRKESNALGRYAHHKQ